MKKYVDTFGEIYLERERYLLNIDELLEEMYSKTRSEITDNVKMKSGYYAEKVCCDTLVDTGEARGAAIEAGE